MPATPAVALPTTSQAASPKTSNFPSDQRQSADTRPGVTAVKPSCPYAASHVRFAPEMDPRAQKDDSTSLPKVISPAMPRFAAEGDTVQAWEIPDGCFANEDAE